MKANAADWPHKLLSFGLGPPHRRSADPFDVARFASLAIALDQSADGTAGGSPLLPSDSRHAIALLFETLVGARAALREGREEVTQAFFACVSRLETALRHHPHELLRLNIVKAVGMIESGHALDAIDAVHGIVERPYLAGGDLALLSDSYLLEVQALMMRGEHRRAAALAWRALDIIGHVAPRRTMEAFRIFAPALQLTDVATLPLAIYPRLVYLLACASIRLTRESGSRLARRAGRLLVFGVNRLVGVAAWIKAFADSRGQAAPASVAASDDERHAILVMRAIGGVGDLIMMAPGLRALARMSGQPVHFAIRRSFFPLFAGNADVKLHDVNGPLLDPQRFRRWYDLSFCPAASYESRHRPHVKKGRIELYANGMGVPTRYLCSIGLLPAITLPETSHRAAERFLGDHGLDDRHTVIGVQAFSRETYRDYPHMRQLIVKLAETFKVVVFHDTAFSLPAHANIIPAFGQPLSDALALLQRCRALVCVDSAFLHAAAAFDIPTVAIFGPIDGEIRTQHYPNVDVVALRSDFKCMPCWRNEETPCLLTGRTESACLAAIDVGAIVRRVDRLLQGLAQPDARIGTGSDRVGELKVAG